MRAGVTPTNLTHSRGVALIAGLLLMASMVLLALAVATGMLLERRMAGNSADGQLALQRAQLAGQWAGYWLQSRAVDPLGDECAQQCGPTPPVHAGGTLPDDPEFEDTAWWRINAVIAGLEPGGAMRMDYSLPGTEAPRWLIEELHRVPLDAISGTDDAAEPTLAYYRILARGTGRYPGSVAVTETVVARPWAESLAPDPFPPEPGGHAFCDQVSDDAPCGRLGWRRRR